MDKIEKLVLKYILYDNFTKEEFNKLSKAEKEKFIKLVKHHSVVKPQ